MSYRETWPATLYSHQKWHLIGKSQWCFSANAAVHCTCLRTVVPAAAASKHTTTPMNHTRPSPDGATIADIRLQITTHLSTPKGWKADLAYLVDMQRMIYPYNWSLIRYRLSTGQEKFAIQKTKIYHCAMPQNWQTCLRKFIANRSCNTTVTGSCWIRY